MCYLSFFRGFASFFAGYIVSIIPLSLAFIILLLPPLVILLPSKHNSQNYILVAIFSWLGGVWFNYIWVKLLFLMVGTSSTFLAMRTNFNVSSSENLRWLPFIFGIDLLLRSPNTGQDFFIHTNLVSKSIGSIIAFSIIYIMYHDHGVRGPSDLNIESKFNFSQLSYTVSFFLIIAIYSVELAGPGVLVVNNLTNQAFAIALSTFTFLIFSLIVSRRNGEINYKFGLFAGLILGLSIYFYPWYGFSLAFWFSAILCIQVLFQLTIDRLTIINEGEKSKYLLAGHYSIIIIMFYGMLTESYLIMPVISIIVGVIFLINKTPTHTKLTNYAINISGIKNKLISLCILILLVTPFIPMESNNHKLDTTDDIRIMTYNLHFGISGNGVDNSEGVINVIKDVNPTIIAFQEVTFAASINGYKNMYSFLKSELGQLGYTNSYFSEGGKYQTRNVIFSKLHIHESETTLLSPRVTYERTLIETKIVSENFEIMIYATHLTHVMEKDSNPDRIKQVQQILNTIDPEVKSVPTILLGDFNAEPDWEEITTITSYLNDSWIEHTDVLDGFTWPNNDPRQRIDYIFHNDYISVESCSVITTDVSDHLPVICNFNFP